MGLVATEVLTEKMAEPLRVLADLEPRLDL